MTFRERLAIEHPDMVDKHCLGGCSDCPCNYGYEELPDGYISSCKATEEECRQCWDREIPGTEKTVDQEPVQEDKMEQIGKILFAAFDFYLHENKRDADTLKAVLTNQEMWKTLKEEREKVK